MRFQVIAVEQPEFDAWVAAQNGAPASAAATYGTDDQGMITYPQEFGICIACHRVNGTPAQFAPMGLTQDPGTLDAPGPARTSGPNLGLFACRSTIGAGILPNTIEDLKAWLRDPGSIKPGNYMATVIQPGTLSEEAVNVIAEFLFSLEPDGGCDSILPGEGTENYDAAQVGLGD
jgi:cytochrome c oxidase subunit 2